MTKNPVTECGRLGLRLPVGTEAVRASESPYGRRVGHGDLQPARGDDCPERAAGPLSGPAALTRPAGSGAWAAAGRLAAAALPAPGDPGRSRAAQLEAKIIIGSLPDTEDMQRQASRRPPGGLCRCPRPLGEDTGKVSLELDLSDAVVILRNDTVGALSALRQGSFSSTFLQQCAMRSCRIHRALRCNALYLHAPGRTLMEEGIKGHSRAGTHKIT